MKNDWLEEVKSRLDAEAAQDSNVFFDRLVASGIINDRGEVTGHVHRWDAFLAITAIKHAGPGKIAEFHCFKPVFGIPGGAPIDVARDSMVAYLKAGKKIITAIRDERLDIWKEGCDVHLSASGFVQSGSENGEGDNVGSLPEFQQSNSRL